MKKKKPSPLKWKDHRQSQKLFSLQISPPPHTPRLHQFPKRNNNIEHCWAFCLFLISLASSSTFIIKLLFIEKGMAFFFKEPFAQRMQSSCQRDYNSGKSPLAQRLLLGLRKSHSSSLFPFCGHTYMYVWAGFSEISVHCYSENVGNMDCVHTGALSTISCLACEIRNIHSGRSEEGVVGWSWCISEIFRFVLWLLSGCHAHLAKWICFSMYLCLHVHTCRHSFSVSICVLWTFWDFL